MTQTLRVQFAHIGYSSLSTEYTFDKLFGSVAYTIAEFEQRNPNLIATDYQDAVISSDWIEVSNPYPRATNVCTSPEVMRDVYIYGL